MRETLCKEPKATRCIDPKASVHKDCGELVYPPCGSVTNSGGAGTTINMYSMGDTAGTVSLSWDMFVIPDRLTVYQGNTLLFDTGTVSGTGSTTIAYNPVNGKLFKIIVEGPGGTSWTYSLGCPV